MFRTLIAKYPGTCKRCHEPIAVGMSIRYGGRGRTYHLSAQCPGARTHAIGSYGGSNVAIDGLDTDDDRESAAATYNPSQVSNHIAIGGRDYYRNKAGRCEDAPCCGCCTI